MAFDTHLLDEAMARRRVALEAERRATLARVLSLLDELGPKYGVRRAYVFGSVTRPGRFGPRSDVDIAVEQLAPQHLCDAIGAFSTALGRQVDVIDLGRCHFAHRVKERGIQWTKTP